MTNQPYYKQKNLSSASEPISCFFLLLNIFKHHQNTIVRGKANAVNDHETKGHMLLAKARGGFPNCRLIKNSGRGAVQTKMAAVDM